jgi:serine protease Do
MRGRLLLLIALAGLAPLSHVFATSDQPVVATKAAVTWDIARTTAPDTLDELKAMQSLLKTTVDKVMPSTVGLLLGQGAGSGVIVSEDGLVLTAAHVIIKPNQDVRIVLWDGSMVSGKTLGMNARYDSGMVKITSKPPKDAKWPGAAEGKWPVVEIGKSAELKKGQYVIALGHPGGPKRDRKPPVRLGQYLSTSQLGRSIRTDCTLVGGDSGGPLFDMSGKLVGIHSRIGLDLETNIHVPTEEFRDNWDKMVKSERVGQEPQVTFGVIFNEAEDTPEVLKVLPESPAENAGLTVGDRVTKFNGRKIERANDVYDLLYDLKPGTTVKVEFRRGEERIEAETTLMARARKPRN